MSDYITLPRDIVENAAKRLEDSVYNYSTKIIREEDFVYERRRVATALRTYLSIMPQPKPVVWTLTKTLFERKTTTNGYLWFSDPKNDEWTPLYFAPPALAVPHEEKT